MSKLKYMGSSHVHTLLKGDDFGGRLGEGIPSDVVFDRSNSWVVDTEEVGLSDDAVEILVKSGDFRNVSGLKRIPSNLHQQIFMAMPASEASDDADEGAPGEDKPDGDDPALDTNPTAAPPTGRRPRTT